MSHLELYIFIFQVFGEFFPYIVIEFSLILLWSENHEGLGKF